MTEFANPNSRKLAGFDVSWVEKWENVLTSYIDLLFTFSQFVKN